MKYSLLLLSLLSLLLLSGCDFDEFLESDQQMDGDDINILQDIGPQALDQMLQGRAAIIAASRASNQSPVLPTISSESSSPVVQSSSTKILEEDNSATKDTYEGENEYEYEGEDD